MHLTDPVQEHRQCDFALPAHKTQTPVNDLLSVLLSFDPISQKGGALNPISLLPDWRSNHCVSHWLIS